MPTFTDELTRLRQGNLMGGFIMAGQAELIKNQTIATQEAMKNFSVRLSALDNEMLPVEEQLAKLQEDPNFQQAAGDLSSQIAAYQATDVNMRNRIRDIQNLYGDTAVQLAFIGGDQAGRLSGVLNEQGKQKIQQMQDARDEFIRKVTFEKTLLQVEAEKLKIEAEELTIDKIKNDKEAASVLTQMILVPESEGGLPATIFFDAYKGTNSLNLDKVRATMYEKFGDKPGFAKAWAGFEKVIQDRTREKKYHFGSGSNSGSGSGTIFESALEVMNRYTQLKNATDKIGKLLYSPNDETGSYATYRRLYKDAASKILTDKDKKSSFDFGRDKRVIDAMKNSDDTSQEMKDAIDLALFLHNNFYNENNGEDNYQRNLKHFKKIIASHLGQPDFNLDPKTKLPLSLPMFGDNTFVLDFSKLINFEGGYYNPYAPYSDWTWQQEEKAKVIQMQIEGKQKMKDDEAIKSLQEATTNLTLYK